VVPLSTVLLRRRTFEDAGGFRLFRYVEDLDLLLRVLERSSLEVVAAPLARYRIHAASTTRALGLEVAVEEAIALCRDLGERYPARRAAIMGALGRYLYVAGKTALSQGRTPLARRCLADSLRLAPRLSTRIVHVLARLAPRAAGAAHRALRAHRTDPGPSQG
jgi:hypothetical protein